MPKKAAGTPADDASAEPKRKKELKEFTPAPTEGGRIGEDGTVLERPQPEPDEQRLTQPETN